MFTLSCRGFIFLTGIYIRNKRESLKVFIFHSICVTPQAFQLIKFSRVFEKNMDHSGEVIDQYPSRIGFSFNMVRYLACVFFYFRNNVVGNCFNLDEGLSLANNKEICWCFFKFSQIQLNDIFCFYILNALYKKCIQRFGI